MQFCVCLFGDHYFIGICYSEYEEAFPPRIMIPHQCHIPDDSNLHPKEKCLVSESHTCWLQAIQCSEDTPQQPDPVGGGYVVSLWQQTVEYYTAGGELWVIARCGSYHTMSCETTRDDVQATATQVHELPPRGKLYQAKHTAYFSEEMSM